MKMRGRLLTFSSAAAAAAVGACGYPSAHRTTGPTGYVRIEALVVDSAARLLPGCSLAVRLQGADATGIVAAAYDTVTDTQGFYRQTAPLPAVYPQIQVRLIATHLGRTETRYDTTQLWLWDPPGDTLRLVLQLH